MACLLVGLASTIGLAWWGAMAGPDGDVASAAVNRAGGAPVQMRGNWMVVAPPLMIEADYSVGEKIWEEMTGRPPSDIRGQVLVTKRAARWHWVTGVGADRLGGGVGILEAGWPLECLSSNWSGFPIRSAMFDHSVEIAGHQLPYRPRVGALVLDTLVMAGFAYCVGWACVTARHAVRRWRGRCPRCAYDLRGSSGRCPECGACPARWRIGPQGGDQ